jgi:Xaa-Pro aminopeptidase
MSELLVPVHEHRLVRLLGRLREDGIDCAVVAGAAPVTHLTGYWRYFGAPPCLVVDSEGGTCLYLSADEAALPPPGNADAVRPYGTRGFGLTLDHVPPLVDALAGDAGVATATRIGLVSLLPGLRDALARRVSASIAPVDPALAEVALVKDADELRLIGRAYELAWTAQAAVRNRATAGVEQITLFTEALAAAQRAAGEPIAFHADVLSGADTASVCAPIRVAGRRRVADDEPIVADLVVGRRGYWGDTAETIVVGTNGDVDAVRTELLSILGAAAARLTPGTPASEIYAFVHGRIVGAFPGGSFPHHAGHAVGLTAFDDPHLIPTDHRTIDSWMVLAVEPGVYFPDWGARVERMFVVTPGGGVEVRDALALLADRDADDPSNEA